MEISKLFGCSRTSILNHLKINGITVRSDQHKIGNISWNKGKTGIHTTGIFNRVTITCDNCGIKYQIVQSSYKLKKANNQSHFFCSKDCYLNFHKEKTTQKTCKMCKKKYITPLYKNRVFCSTKCQLGYYNIHPSNNPNWNNGSSFEPYCDKFSNDLREFIRKRDNRTCQRCGLKENGKKLSVHHIHYDKENCNPDLITLCVSCNSSVNSNRDYWEKYFMDILIERGYANPEQSGTYHV